MQIIKLFILFIIFLLSNIIGKIVSGKYKYRLGELKEMKNAINIFKTKIKFTYEPIPEIFEEISKSTNKKIASIFIDASKKMKEKTASQSWNEAIDNSENNLTVEDKNTLKVLSKLLGEADVEGQISQIDITLNFLEKQIQEAEEEKNKNEKLYRKLGTVMGFALVIILI